MRVCFIFLLPENASASTLQLSSHVSFDPQHLPDDLQALKQLVLELMAQLDRESSERAKVESLLRELLDAKRHRKSEQLSADQLTLFASLWQTRQAQTPPETGDSQPDSDDDDAAPGSAGSAGRRHGGGRQLLPRHLKRERIVHDLAAEEKHCASCHQDLRLIGEESSERYEYVPAQLTEIEQVCRKYACGCTVRTASKPPQPIEKSTAGASLLAQVIVAKTADHLPLHRQQQIFARHGVEISRQTMCGWLAQSAALLQPLYTFIVSSRHNLERSVQHLWSSVVERNLGCRAAKGTALLSPRRALLQVIAVAQHQIFRTGHLKNVATQTHRKDVVRACKFGATSRHHGCFQGGAQQPDAVLHGRARTQRGNPGSFYARLTSLGPASPQLFRTSSSSFSWRVLTHGA
jgi:transposase